MLFFRSLYDSFSFYDLVSICEAQNLAESLGYLYKEVSAQTGDQVADAFESAVKLGHAKRKEEGSLSQKRSNTISNSFDPTWIPPMSECKIDIQALIVIPL